MDLPDQAVPDSDMTVQPGSLRSAGPAEVGSLLADSEPLNRA